MSRDWEATYTAWSTGPSQTEQQCAENAERQVREAISASAKLNQRNIRVFTQGSYRNRVNVRRDGDVDVGVLCFDTYFPHYPDDNTKMLLAKSTASATYTYATFKNELGVASENGKIKHAKPLLTQMFDCSWHFHHGNCNCPTLAKCRTPLQIESQNTSRANQPSAVLTATARTHAFPPVEYGPPAAC